MISHTPRPDGVREINGVCLSDTEDAAKIKKEEGIFVQVGNVLWRSPEAQTGTRVGKASDVWSFGTTVINTLLENPALILYLRGELRLSLT
jgi:serine/threonine protein kinase